MCCLFGVIDYKNTLSGKQKTRLVSALAVAAEARGTDATGIAYNSAGALRIYKRPWPGHCMRFAIPRDARVVMGHTRLTTQGNEKRNFNNHPFAGKAGGQAFALAHNGVLFNDRRLRQTLVLPQTKIETDSYVAVQLLEQQNVLHLDSLRTMAEQVEGSFVFTILEENDTFYVVKGDNPLCIYHFEQAGVYVYASTEEILKKALAKANSLHEKPKKVPLSWGELVRIDPHGQITLEEFDPVGTLGCHVYSYPYRSSWEPPPRSLGGELEYLEELKCVASAFGYTPESVDHLLAQGFTPEDIEEFLYA